jgi:hypothetical protein
MALLTPQVLDENTPVAKLANVVLCNAGGDTCPNDGFTFLLFVNGDAGSHTITITPAKATVKAPGGLGVVTKANVSLAVGTLDEALLGPFPPGLFNDGNGNIAISYNSVAALVKIVAIRMARS